MNGCAPLIILGIVVAIVIAAPGPFLFVISALGVVYLLLRVQRSKRPGRNFALLLSPIIVLLGYSLYRLHRHESIRSSWDFATKHFVQVAGSIKQDGAKPIPQALRSCDSPIPIVDRPVGRLDESYFWLRRDLRGEPTANVRYVAFLRRDKIFVGEYYTQGGPRVGISKAYRHVAHLEILDVKGLELMVQKTFTGSDPPAKVPVGGGNGYGSEPKPYEIAGFVEHIHDAACHR